MSKNNVVIALAIALSFGLGACSKHNPKSIKAQAEIAKTQGTEQQDKVYGKAEDAIDKEIAELGELQFFAVGKGVKGIVAVKTGTDKASNENLTKVRKHLANIKENAETQIQLAKKLGRTDLISYSEQTKSNAENAINYVEGRMAKGQEAAEKQKNEQNEKLKNDAEATKNSIKDKAAGVKDAVKDFFNRSK